MSSTLTCAACGGSIGIYEPHILRNDDGQDRLTVYATELQDGPQTGKRFHRHCAPAARPTPGPKSD